MTEREWLSSLDAQVTEEHRRLFARNRKQGWLGIRDALNETRETADPDLVPYVTYAEVCHKLDDRIRLHDVTKGAFKTMCLVALIGWGLALGLAVLG